MDCPALVINMLRPLVAPTRKRTPNLTEEELGLGTASVRRAVTRAPLLAVIEEDNYSSAAVLTGTGTKYNVIAQPFTFYEPIHLVILMA